MTMKLPWPNPVLVFARKGSLFQFRSLHHVVLIRETVSRISVQQMTDLKDMNKRFEDKLMAHPFIVLDTGDSATAFSPDGASGPVDLDSLPLIDMEAPIDEGIILVNCSNTMTVYSLKDNTFSLRMHDLLMSSVMCMPTVLHENDIPFLLQRRHEYADKQIANSRIVLQSDSCISLYNICDFSLVKTIYRRTS